MQRRPLKKKKKKLSVHMLGIKKSLTSRNMYPSTPTSSENSRFPLYISPVRRQRQAGTPIAENTRS